MILISIESKEKVKNHKNFANKIEKKEKLNSKKGMK